MSWLLFVFWIGPDGAIIDPAPGDRHMATFESEEQCDVAGSRATEVLARHLPGSVGVWVCLPAIRFLVPQEEGEPA